MDALAELWVPVEKFLIYAAIAAVIFGIILEVLSLPRDFMCSALAELASSLWWLIIPALVVIVIIGHLFYP